MRLSIASLSEALDRLATSYERKAEATKLIVKLGRTQSRDAVPMTVGQELGAYAVTIREDIHRLFVSVITFAEIRFGIERVADHARRTDLHDWLTHQVRSMFDGRVLPISEDVMLKWRLMVEEGRRAGHTFPQPDLIVAATASVHGMTVVTRDTGGFAPARVSVFNPWTEDARAVR